MQTLKNLKPMLRQMEILKTLPDPTPEQIEALTMECDMLNINSPDRSVYYCVNMDPKRTMILFAMPRQGENSKVRIYHTEIKVKKYS